MSSFWKPVGMIALTLALACPTSGQAQGTDVGGITLESAVKLGRNVPIKTIIDFLDEVSRKQKINITRGKLRTLIPQLKLCVHSATIEVVVEGEETIWRGTTSVKLSMPADVQYYVDLEDMQPKHLKWDKARKILKVTVPQVRIGAVVPKLEEETVEITSDWTRPMWFRGGNVSELETRLRREDYRPAAVKEAEKRLEDARRSARDQIRDLLRRLWLPHDSTIEIIVE